MGSPALFEVRNGISMGGSQMLTGEGAPGGNGGYEDEAGRGSLYLAAGELIIARLKERLPDLAVNPSWSLSELQETPELAPSLLVLLEGDLPGPPHAKGRLQKVEQRWCVVAVVREAESEASALIVRTLNALAGWTPGAGFTPCNRVPSRFSPDKTPGGFYYFPMTFATEFVFAVEP